MSKLDRFKKTNPQTSSDLLTRGTISNNSLKKSFEFERIVPLTEGSVRSNGGDFDYRSNLNQFGVIKANYNLSNRSHNMSLKMTPAECHIWFNLLSKRNFRNLKFVKQKIIGNYILDFYCSELLLCVEIDGETHDVEYDKVHDQFMASIGITTLRFSNDEVLNNLEGVKVAVEQAMKKLNY